MYFIAFPNLMLFFKILNSKIYSITNFPFISLFILKDFGILMALLSAIANCIYSFILSEVPNI